MGIYSSLGCNIQGHELWQWHKLLARLQLAMNPFLHNYTFGNLSFYFNLSRIIRLNFQFPDFIDLLILLLHNNLQPLIVTMTQRKSFYFQGYSDNWYEIQKRNWALHNFDIKAKSFNLNRPAGLIASASWVDFENCRVCLLFILDKIRNCMTGKWVCQCVQYPSIHFHIVVPVSTKSGIMVEVLDT
jgi:hypothetical protein